MSPARDQAPRGPVVVCAPSGKDAEMIVQVIGRDGIPVQAYYGMAGLCMALEGGAEAAVVAEEAITVDAIRLLAAVLDTLPRWSDPPIIILGAPNRETSVKLFGELSRIANLSLVERPTRPFTLLASVRSALRARARQHESRLLLDEVEKSRAELAKHRDELVEAVRTRTQELQSANQALRLSERMAAIGTLSAGIGHDIANLLLPVRVHVDALEQEGRDSANPSDHVPAIRACIAHLQRLSAGLRQLALDPEDSGASGIGGEDTDLKDWWETAEPVIRNTLPRCVRLQAEITPGLHAAIAPHQLSQAIVNLVQNAGDAIASKGAGATGCVTVRAKRGRHGLSLSQGSWPGDDRVRVSVTDDGPGMSEEIKRRCLEPLFTTKTRRLSTGLGLILVKGVVQRAKGELSIQSEPGRGTTFTLTLPIPPTSCIKRPPATVSVRDPRFRGFIASTLRSLGYEPRPFDPAAFAPPTDAPHAEEEESAMPAIWVTDPDVATTVDFKQFMDGHPERRVVVLGPGRMDAADERLVDFPQRPGPTQLREVLSSLGSRS